MRVAKANGMKQGNNSIPHASLIDTRTSRQIINDFFCVYHPAQAAEYFREIAAVLSTPGMTITEYEELEYRQFFERINEVLQANYSSDHD